MHAILRTCWNPAFAHPFWLNTHTLFIQSLDCIYPYSLALVPLTWSLNLLLSCRTNPLAVVLAHNICFIISYTFSPCTNICTLAKFLPPWTFGFCLQLLSNHFTHWSFVSRHHCFSAAYWCRYMSCMQCKYKYADALADKEKTRRQRQLVSKKFTRNHVEAYIYVRDPELARIFEVQKCEQDVTTRPNSGVHETTTWQAHWSWLRESFQYWHKSAVPPLKRVLSNGHF